ncbi:unnamed protein product [Heligmosomoides polygyrus]|uniref:Endo/exonuclease/phosphatase domain-containing protein n=1 Tax=Heligmosomoides polygyrus TaxID=6339 RepID=A0A3P8FPE7_HELPZ|nr:unnamed protein product [Heligmosomoides polygyrus]
MEKFYKEDHTFYKVIVGDFNAKIGPRRFSEELHFGTHSLEWNEQGERLHKFYTGSDHRPQGFAFRVKEKAAKFKKRNPRTTINWDFNTSLAGLWKWTTSRNTTASCTISAIVLSEPKAWSSTYKLPSELAKLCRAAIKEDLKERRAEVLSEAAEAGLSICNVRRNFANFKTNMTALRRPDGTVTFSRRTMEKVIHDLYSDLFDSHVHLPLAIFRRMDTSFPLFSLPRSDTPSRR